MATSRLEAHFLKQARFGPGVWRMRRLLALAMAAGFAVAAAVRLWVAWSKPAPEFSDLLGVLVLVAVAATFGVYVLLASLMQGAADHLRAKQSLNEGPLAGAP